MEIFTWTPDFNSDSDETPDVTAVKFGDGYEQRTANGINSNRQTWNLTFSNRDTTEKDLLVAFLRDRGATEAFNWTPPYGSELVFVCRSWRPIPVKANLWTITAAFEQVYEP